MDEFNRASTSLVSPFNYLHIHCGNSELQNKIQVTIPTGQRAPYWAKKYKFCIKADKDTYETVYSSFFFRDPTSGADFFLLDGQNSQKVEVGDELIVKADTSGPTSNCVYTTVLEKEAQPAGFLEPAPVDDQGTEIKLPQGVYMKLKANNFSTTTDIGDGLPQTWTQGEKKTTSDRGNKCAPINYQVNVEDPANPGTYVDLPIPAGSRILIKYESYRIGRSCKKTERRLYRYENNFTSSQNYTSFYYLWIGDNVAGTLNASFVKREAQCNQGEPEATFYPGIVTSPTLPCTLGVGIQFVQASATSKQYLRYAGILGYNDRKKQTNNKLEVVIQRSNSLVVF